MTSFCLYAGWVHSDAGWVRSEITTFAEWGKIQLTPKITDHLCTCYSNCMCKSNPVCLIQQSSVIILLASYYPLHCIEFGPPKFFSKTFTFSIIFYSTLQISGGGHFRKACRSPKKESKPSEITCKQSEPARIICKIRKEENLYVHCATTRSLEDDDPLHHIEIPIEIHSKMKLFRPKPATRWQWRAFWKNSSGIVHSTMPIQFFSFQNPRNGSNRFRLVECDFGRFRFFFPVSACFSKLAPPGNFPSWVKYSGKLESFAKEFWWTKFNAVERRLEMVKELQNRNPEWWEDFSQQVKIEKNEFLGISQYKVESSFWLYFNSEVSRGSNSNWDSLFNLNLQLTKISPPFRNSMCISFTISSLIFQGTGCINNARRILSKGCTLLRSSWFLANLHVQTPGLSAPKRVLLNIYVTTLDYTLSLSHGFIFILSGFPIFNRYRCAQILM